MVDFIRSWLEENLFTVGAIAGLMVIVFAGVSSLSFSEPRDYQGMDCETLLPDNNVQCSDLDTWQDSVRGVSSPDSEHIWVQLYSVESEMHGDEPVYTFWMYNNGFAEEGDYGSSIGPEDLTASSSDYQSLADNSKCSIDTTLERRDDDVFITTSEGEFNFDKDPENPGEQHVRELDLGRATAEAEEVRIVPGSFGSMWCKFDFYDIAKQSVEAEFPGEFERLDSYGAWKLAGTVTTDFAIDSDGDGVVDSEDSCSGTPSSAEVDSSGCAVDSDGDGVADINDSCEGVWGSKSDGCPTIWDELFNLVYRLPLLSR